jgi:hypothetical protein
MTLAEFEPTILASELPLTQALDRATIGICKYSVLIIKMYSNVMQLKSYNINLLIISNGLKHIMTVKEWINVAKRQQSAQL